MEKIILKIKRSCIREYRGRERSRESNDGDKGLRKEVKNTGVKNIASKENTVDSREVEEAGEEDDRKMR